MARQIKYQFTDGNYPDCRAALATSFVISFIYSVRYPLGHFYKYMTGIYAPNMIDNIVENIANSPLLFAIFALFSIMLSTYLLSQY